MIDTLIKQSFVIDESLPFSLLPSSCTYVATINVKQNYILLNLKQYKEQLSKSAKTLISVKKLDCVCKCPIYMVY